MKRFFKVSNKRVFYFSILDSLSIFSSTSLREIESVSNLVGDEKGLCFKYEL